MDSYYSVLGVNENSSDEAIRRAYKKLAMKWHPDKWTKSPSLLGEAQRKFQLIQEAYSVLSDRRKRTLYDGGLYNPTEEETDEEFSDFMQEMASLMGKVKREEKEYTMGDLQCMFDDMAKGFEFQEWPTNYDFPGWDCDPFAFNNTSTKRARCF